ncbi:MAG TPA: pyrroloquinoline quinone biosynthesis peptide chaperone PqqD [Candidatus Eremiobacteraceae bacterium]|nr:pyrroloquinoline quinone biosynthesis peptide chaperone PqqD [Candidatus Eremiobacteraceae bacterium]
MGDPGRDASGVWRGSRRGGPDVNAPQLSRGVRFRRTPGGQGVLLIPEGVVNLNDSAAAIVELIDGSRSVASIAADLCARYKLDQAEMASDIETLMQRLAENNWLTLTIPAKPEIV